MGMFDYSSGRKIVKVNNIYLIILVSFTSKVYLVIINIYQLVLQIIYYIIIQRENLIHLSLLNTICRAVCLNKQL